MTDELELTDDQLEAMGEVLLERMGAAIEEEKEKTRIIIDGTPEERKIAQGDTITVNGEEAKVTSALSEVGQEEVKAEIAASLSKGENDPVVPPKMTRKVWKQMMRMHFTVRRATVKTCGHKINIESDPRNNCPECWFAYFNNNGQMTKIADECFTEAGRDVLERSRGKKFVKYFLMFMSTIARFQREAAARAIAEKEAKSVEESETNGTSGDAGDDRGGSPVTDTSIGGIAGEAENIGGVSSEASVNDFVPENPINEGSAEGLGSSIG